MKKFSPLLVMATILLLAGCSSTNNYVDPGDAPSPSQQFPAHPADPPPANPTISAPSKGVD